MPWAEHTMLLFAQIVAVSLISFLVVLALGFYILDNHYFDSQPWQHASIQNYRAKRLRDRRFAHS